MLTSPPQSYPFILTHDSQIRSRGSSSIPTQPPSSIFLIMTAMSSSGLNLPSVIQVFERHSEAFGLEKAKREYHLAIKLYQELLPYFHSPFITVPFRMLSLTYHLITRKGIKISTSTATFNFPPFPSANTNLHLKVAYPALSYPIPSK